MNPSGPPPMPPHGIPGAPPPASPKRSPTALIIAGVGCAVLLVVVGIVALLAAIAVPNFLRAKERSIAAQSLSQARTLYHACQLYAVDHGDTYPPNLEALVPDYVGSPSSLVDSISKNSGSKIPENFVYTQPRPDSPRDTVVISSPRKSPRGTHVIVQFDGTAEIMGEIAPAKR